MQDTQKSSAAQQAIVMWTIWFAILVGLFVIAFFAAPKAEPGEAVDGMSLSPILLIGIAAAIGSFVVRFVMIPTIQATEKRMVAMIVGLAMAEGCGMLGMFVVNPMEVATRTLMFSIAVAAVLVSAPIYAHKASKTSAFHQS